MLCLNNHKSSYELINRSEINIQFKDLVFFLSHYSRLLVFSHSLLKEIGFTLKTDHVHPVKWILRVVYFRIAEWIEQSISHKFHVQFHQLQFKTNKYLGVHPNKFNGNAFTKKFDFYINSFSDNRMDSFFSQLVFKMTVQKTCEVSMHAFISTYQFVREGESRHQLSFFEPENSTEWTTEENPFNSSKSN